jgi:two-component sensor histidine kinase
MLAVRRYDILDTPPDGTFDRITALAARRFNTPIAIISIVDTDRIWFKSGHGVPVTQIGREPGLCASAILSNDPHIVEDARSDVRTLANPLVAGDFGLRFYAGVPLQTSDGFNLGTLCVIDREARTIDQGQIDDLKDLASVVMDQLELRLSARRSVAKAETMAREIDHRVMNSLQFVSSMLAMQSRSADLTDAASQLKIAANRVNIVARIHRHYMANDSNEPVVCLEYLQRLCADLAGLLGRQIDVTGDGGAVPAHAIQSIGLIVNELATNAAKYSDGTITVTCVADGANRVLIVSDKGVGFPPDFNPATVKTGLGMKVVGLLAQQLRGNFTCATLEGGAGAICNVTFPGIR